MTTQDQHSAPQAEDSPVIAAHSGETYLRVLIANDAYAMSFQTMGQYRAALLKCAAPTPVADSGAMRDALSECVRIIEDNSRRIGYSLGSPYDKTVKRARALLAAAPVSVDEQQAGRERDTERLDWLVAQQAWIQWTVRDGSIHQCQVYDQDEDENYHVLSGDDRYFNTPREAIDAAIDRAATTNTGDAS
jgi:hypothetical protein